MAVQIVAARGDSIVSVYVTPRAGRSEVVGERQGALWVRLAAPPAAGAANRALIGLLADRLGLPPAAVHLVGGASSRQKRVRIRGVPPEAIAARLGLGQAT